MGSSRRGARAIHFFVARTDRESPLAVLVPPLACGFAYFLGASRQVAGLSLRTRVGAVGAECNTLAALLLAPYRRWWRYLLAVLPFHLLAQVPVFPLPLVAIHYAFNRRQRFGFVLDLAARQEPRRFDRLQTTTILVVFAAFPAPLLTSY
jgi:integral membrane sensor domain MASE1